MLSKSIHPVFLSISQKTGLPPALITEFAVATKVWVGTITSLFLILRLSRAISKAVPPEFTAVAKFTFVFLQNKFSNLFKNGPELRIPLFKIFFIVELIFFLSKKKGFAPGIFFIKYYY